MVKIYHVVSEAQIGFTKEEEFRLAIREVEAKESEQTYSWKGRRIKKSELNQLYSDHYKVCSVKYGIYTDEMGLEEAKEKVIEAVRNKIERNLQTVKRMQSLASKEPIVDFKVREIIE